MLQYLIMPFSNKWNNKPQSESISDKLVEGIKPQSIFDRRVFLHTYIMIIVSK
jgi:hypothetical protein